MYGDFHGHWLDLTLKTITRNCSHAEIRFPFSQVWEKGLGDEGDAGISCVTVRPDWFVR
jgi:hypothetical protein